MPTQNTRCYLCSSSDISLVHKGTRDNSLIDVLECNKCGLVFLSSFDHLSDTYYESSQMHGVDSYDVDKWIAQTMPDDMRRWETLRSKMSRHSVMDFGCGNGNFLRLAARECSYVAGIELEETVRQSLIQNGFDVYKELQECQSHFDYITMFHVLEHLADPVSYLSELKAFLEDKGRVIIEVPNANDALLRLYDCRAFSDFTYWSCHLFLYNANTISLLAQKAGYQVEWLRPVQRYSLANHLYWLSLGKPGGHHTWGRLDSDALSKAYADQLAKQNATDTILCSLQVDSFP